MLVAVAAADTDDDAVRVLLCTAVREPVIVADAVIEDVIVDRNELTSLE